MMRLRWLYTILIVEQIIASGTFLAAKWALLEFPPLTLAFLRFVIAAGGLYIIHRLWPQRKPIARRDWKSIALLGFLAVVVNQAFFLYGLKFTSPTHAALLYGATPVLVFLMAIPLLGERPTLLKKIGVPVTFAGVIVVIAQRGLEWSSKAWLGDLLILVAVVAWALYTVLGKPLCERYGAVHVTAMSLVAGTVFFVPIGLFTLGGFDAGSISTRGWLSLLYIAIATSVICYTIWFWALERLEATKVSVFNNLQPVITALLSFWLLGEKIGGQLIVGGVLVIIGVVLTERG
ncbi:MAG: DMT family transporter [Candidatus Zixiibacteriota bacterium]